MRIVPIKKWLMLTKEGLVTRLINEYQDINRVYVELNEWRHIIDVEMEMHRVVMEKINDGTIKI